MLLLGRGRELGWLRGRIEDATPVVVVGEAGVGKTALVRAAAADARPLHEGGAFATLAWMPLFALSRAVGRQLPEGDAVFVAREVERAVGDGVLFVDDCQWTDPLTLEVVATLARRVALVTAVRRGDERADDALAALAAFERLELEPLDASLAAALARARRPELPSHVVEGIVRQSGGNPLLVEQLAEVGGPTESLRLAVAARLRHLSPDARAAMTRLALLGRPAERSLLGAGAGELVRTGLAVEERETVVVRHALLADAAVAALDDQERRAVHARLAAELADEGESARHHLAAGEREQAAAKALAAAAAAATPGERAEHLRVAADATDDAQLRLEAATVLHDARRLNAAEALLEGLALDDPEQRAHASYLRAAIAVERADADGARAAVAEGLSHVTASDSVAEVRLVHAAAQIAFWLDNDFAEAQRLSRRAHELGRDRGVDEARLLGMLGATLGSGPNADVEAAARVLREATEVARRDGDHMTELKAAYNRFLIGAADTYDYEAERPVVESLLGRSRELKLTMFEHAFRVLLGRYDFHFGEYRKAVDNLHRLVDEPLHPQQLWLARTWLTLSLVELGELELAAEQVAAMEADPAVRTVKAVTTNWLAAEVALAGGRAREAFVAADAAATDPNSAASGWGVGAALVRAWSAYELGVSVPPGLTDVSAPHLPDTLAAQTETEAVAALACGDFDAAPAAFESARALWELSNKRGELRCAWALAELARLRGDAQEARARLELVEAEATVREMRTLLARTRRSLRLVGARRGAARATRGELTAREHEVLELVAAGLTNATIAARLGVTVPTVERQIASASRKLGARNRAHAAVLAAGR